MWIFCVFVWLISAVLGVDVGWFAVQAEKWCIRAFVAPVPAYCDKYRSYREPSSYLPPSFSAYTSVISKKLLTDDREQVLALIRAYAPVVYLHPQEIYLPIRVDEYFSGFGTALKNRAGSIEIPAGHVTFNTLYTKFYKNLAHKNINTHTRFIDASVYIDNPYCVRFGANPNNSKNVNTRGELIVPVYVVTSLQDNKLYIQYLYWYGFNGQYALGPIVGDIFKIQCAHEADLEHMTLEFDSKTRALLRIYFSAHEVREGTWLDAHDPRIQHEPDGRIIVYSALGAHGCFPLPGTYRHGYGFLNDHTGKGLRWVPQNLIRIYPDGDARFSPDTMGWMYFWGHAGKRGVNPTGLQKWFPKIDQNTGKNVPVIGVTGDLGGHGLKFFKKPPRRVL